MTVLGVAQRPGAAQPARAKGRRPDCADPAFPHAVQTLAAHAQVSVRHMTRLFRAEFERSPAEYVASTRFGVARDMLHAGHSVTEAAMAAGYGSGEALRRTWSCTPIPTRSPPSSARPSTNWPESSNPQRPNTFTPYPKERQ
ncbi:helix-turn-helix domain-containing protein [Nocardia sp. NBC_00881]|uniref:helix-turn-helix domain-containing protein n=1 Tax=Nocardia sp. NBC_00881 TaxID=2975995 RepID=UPI00386516D9|nr:helix-turn-helix domain-containing protein [Nocardia sp. NBC_00881]